MLRNLRAWLLRLVGSLRGIRGDGDLSDELASHLQLHIDDNLRAGMSPEGARRQALLKLGGVTQTKEAHRDRRGLPSLDALGRDVRYAIRFLRRSPGFTTVAVLSLALGIGANTAIFSLVDSLLLRSLPVKQPDRLVEIRTAATKPGERGYWTNPIWEQIRDRPGLFAAACAFGEGRFNLAPHGEMQPVNGLLVSGRFFDVLGVQPILGRSFTPADDRHGGGADGPVAIISYAFWQSHFNGAGDVIGRSLSLNGVLLTVIGVTPRSFFGPSVGARFDVAVPLGLQPRLEGFDSLEQRSSWWLAIMARLEPGQTVAAASAALQAAQPAIRQATLPPNYLPQLLGGYLKDPLVVEAASAGVDSPVRSEYRLPLLALMAVVGLVLLIACVNLANLLMARADGRRHELGIRLAIGASRARLVRQLLIESLLLSCAGAALGLIFAAWGSRLILTQLTALGLSASLNLSLTWSVLGFTVGVSVLVALLFGTIPALRATGVRPDEVMDGRPSRMNGHRRRPFSGWLVALQLASCLVLLVGAGMFLETFVSLERLQPGFDETPILVVELNAARTTGLTATTRQAVLTAVQAAPGVRTAAWSLVAPLNRTTVIAPIQNPPGVSLSDRERMMRANEIGPGWLSTMGTALVAGREFNAHDTIGAPAVTIVNEAFAKKIFPGASALGRTIQEVQSPGAHHPVMTIVGVAQDAIYDSLRNEEPPTLYMPLAQMNSKRPPPFLTLCVRAADGSATAILRDTASAISRAAPDVQFTLHTMDDLAGDSLSSERLLAMLSGFFGALALLLAAIGLYGVVSYSVNRRRTEIGIRMALGARPGGIVRMMLARIGLTLATGLAIGAVLSVWLATFVKSLLYGLQPDDPATLAGAIAVLAAVGLLAAWLPARRAARIDPMEALREN